MAPSQPTDHESARARSSRLRHLGWAALLAGPASIFVALIFIVPILGLAIYSISTQHPDGSIGLPLTLSNFSRLFEVQLYFDVLVTTLRISLVSSLICALVGYPVAMAMVWGKRLTTSLLTMAVLSPLLVSVVVRTYGWQLVLANSNTGLLNWILMSLGLTGSPVRLMYSESAIIIGSVHVHLPLMVLPLAASIGRINLSLVEAARTLGSSSMRIFLKIILPLSIPGLTAGLALNFSLTASSYVQPRILGGMSGQMLGTLIEQQAIASYDWPFAAAIAMVLVISVVLINGVARSMIELRSKFLERGEV
ncbi:ABC transporter permease (plasmid) [Rhizobium sp. NIBRBAC000502774]|nr:ABC transporter permease [Rhizobium sp. NIBRBAC000502774]